MKIGKKLKTTGNARKMVSGKPASVKVPGLPGLKGGYEAKATKAMKPKKMVDKDCDGY